MKREKKPIGWEYLIPIALMLLLFSPIAALEIDAHSGGNKWAKAYLSWLETPPLADDIAAGGNKFAALPIAWGYERVRCDSNGALRCWKKK
jgi:hypothetical protein